MARIIRVSVPWINPVIHTTLWCIEFFANVSYIDLDQEVHLASHDPLTGTKRVLQYISTVRIKPCNVIKARNEPNNPHTPWSRAKSSQAHRIPSWGNPAPTLESDGEGSHENERCRNRRCNARRRTWTRTLSRKCRRGCTTCRRGSRTWKRWWICSKGICWV